MRTWAPEGGRVVVEQVIARTPAPCAAAGEAPGFWHGGHSPASGRTNPGAEGCVPEGKGVPRTVFYHAPLYRVREE